MRRLFEFIPGALAWLTLILMFVLSWKLPTAISIFIILFDIYWLLKTVYLSLHLRATFAAMRGNLKLDWLEKLKSSALPWRDIYHLIILPMYREPYEVVKESFESLSGANYPKDRFLVVLATEEAAGDAARAVAERVRTEFGGKFFKFLVTEHPKNLPGEIPGKGSNETWAARRAKEEIIDPLVNAQTYADDTQTNAEKEFLYADLTYKIRGAVFSVRKKIGLGHKEIIYQNAIEEEFVRLGLNFEKEKVIEILYEDKKIGIYRPDFVVENKVILELKALPFINKIERRQIWQYLKGSSYKLALLINFGGNDVYMKRIVYDTARELPRRSASSQRESALKYENILVSVFDIDTQVFKEYFGRLAYVFLNAQNRLRAIYQPIPLFTNNIYKAPAFARVVSFSSTFWQMMQQSRPERLTSFSSQSLPFKALVDIGFWNTDIVSEDSRIFWQCYLHYHGDFRVEPVLYPVSMDANVAPTFWQTLKNLYKQQRRWGWGCENIPYMFCGNAEANPREKKVREISRKDSRSFASNEGFLYDSQIPRWKKWYWSFNVIEGFHSWATNSLMIFALGWLPLILGGREFHYTLLSYGLPQITRFIISLSMVGIASSAILGILLLPPRPSWFRLRHHIIYFFQWLLMPVTLIVFGALPGLEAQTRLMLGGKWRLGFWPTPKSRQ
jgi:GxxExxY protein